ncbi:MAG: hypothetical protein V3T58_04445 [Candidatus Hydrothermarchaeales archaeon]
MKAQMRFNIADLVDILIQKKDPSNFHLTKKRFRMLKEALQDGKWDVIRVKGIKG